MSEPSTLGETFNNLTAGQAEDLENALDMGVDHISDIINGSGPKMKVLRAVMWIVKREDDPGLAFDDLRSISLEELMSGQNDPKAPDEPTEEPDETPSGQDSSEPSDGLTLPVTEP